jgi:hypothetical protein
MKEADRLKEVKVHHEERKAEEELMGCTFSPNLTKSMSGMSFNNGPNSGARHSSESGTSAGRLSGEFGRGDSFAFSEAGDETEKRSPRKSVGRSPAISPASSASAVSAASAASPAAPLPAAVSPVSPAGLKPIPAGLPAGLTALNLSPAAASGLTSLRVMTAAPETAEAVEAVDGN